jgi:phytoene desaturase
MNSRSSKRAVVVGAGLGGLSAAIHLRLRHFEVTVYEANDLVGGRANLIKLNGFTFDTGPTLLNYPWVFEELFRMAGARLQDYVELLPVDPSIRFLWPSGDKLQLSSNINCLVSEFERLQPGSSLGLFEFLADAAKKYRISFDKLICKNAGNLLSWLGSLSPLELARLGIWHSLDRELARFFKNRFIREALGSYGMYLGGSPLKLPGIFSILPYGEISRGLWLPRGGIYALVEAMARLAQSIGVNIVTGQPVTQIVTQDQKVTGITLTEGQFVASPLVVSNVDVPFTQRQLLSAGGYTVPKTLKMTPAVMTFYWAVEKAVPGAGHHTIFMPDDPAKAYDELISQHLVPGDLPFYVSVASQTDSSLAPQGCSSIFILVPLPLDNGKNPYNCNELAGQLQGRVLHRMQRHGIGLSADDITSELVLTPSDWGRRFGLYQNSAFGAAHTLFQMGNFRYPNQDRKLGGLYYTGASTTPGTGMPMAVLSGKMTAERICADVC